VTRAVVDVAASTVSLQCKSALRNEDESNEAVDFFVVDSHAADDDASKMLVMRFSRSNLAAARWVLLV
jgi:hypothetical protein